MTVCFKLRLTGVLPVLSLALSLMVAGCGDSTTTTTATPQAAGSATTPVKKASDATTQKPAAPDAAASAPVLKLRWAHTYQPTEVYHVQAEAAAKSIEQKTEGRVHIDVVAAGALGKESDYPEMLSKGDLEMCYCGMAMLAKQYPPLLLGHFPFAFKDIEHVRKYLVSPLLDDLRKGYEDQTGNVLLSGVYYGARHVTSNKPLERPADFKGMRFRVADAEPYRLFANAMGAKPVTLGLGAVYDALKKGEIDMQENPLPTIKNRRFFEVQKYVVLTAHIYDITSITIGKSAWDKLAPGDKQIVRAAIKDAATWTTVGVISQELTDEANLKADGMTILRVDRAVLRDQTMQFAKPEVLGARPGDFQRLQEIAAKRS